mgnify:FL=1
MKISGKTILITGGTSGIGLESARQFLAEGANVIVTGRNQDKLDFAKKMLPQLTVIKSDVEKQDDAVALFEKVSSLVV